MCAIWNSYFLATMYVTMLGAPPTLHSIGLSLSSMSTVALRVWCLHGMQSSHRLHRYVA